MTKVDLVRDWVLSRIGNPYIMGGTGQPCTVAYREARAAQYPASAAKIRKNCQRMNGSSTTCKGCRYYDDSTGKGKRAYDCAQLTRWVMDEVGISLVSGATSQWNKTKWEQRGKIDSLPKDKLCLLYRQDSPSVMGHTGVYLGDNTAVHAKGHDYGVVRETLQQYSRWTHWGIPVGLYDTPEELAKDVVRFGDTGTAVKALQELLMAAGFGLPTFGADGDFGNETKSALMRFQTSAGIVATGRADETTMEALTNAAAEGNTDDDVIQISESSARELYNILSKIFKET